MLRRLNSAAALTVCSFVRRQQLLLIRQVVVGLLPRQFPRSEELSGTQHGPAFLQRRLRRKNMNSRLRRSSKTSLWARRQVIGLRKVLNLRSKNIRSYLRIGGILRTQVLRCPQTGRSSLQRVQTEQQIGVHSARYILMHRSILKRLKEMGPLRLYIRQEYGLA